MQFKNSSKQRNVQGLRSFRDTLPKNIKKIINKKGHIYSETLNRFSPTIYFHLLIVSEYTCPFLLITFLTFFGKVSLKDLKP